MPDPSLPYASPSTAARPAATRAFPIAGSVLAVAAVYYGWLLSKRGLDLFGPEQFGLAFNSMLDHMLQGRWDVDPASIGKEGFVHQGRVYAYFGPFLAILRLPLTLLPDWQSLHVERLSCWLAIVVGIAAQCSAVTTSLGALAEPLRRPLVLPLLLVCAMSGAPMLLSWKGAVIYHEAMLWAWALAMAFVALALPAVGAAGPISRRRLSALGWCAGLCLLTRSTTGAGLVAATGLLLARELLRPQPAGPSPGRWSLWAPACVLGLFVLLAGLVNQGRWGNPFLFADVGEQIMLLDEYPDRLARLQRHGLFEWRRLGTGLLYYFLPVWTHGLEQVLPLEARLLDWYDAVERPPSSLLLTDPVWFLLSGLGVTAILRRRAAIGSVLLAAGLSVAPALMLVAWYLAFRYRAEFAPLMLALSCIGLRAWLPGLAPQGRHRAVLLLSALCVAQIGGAALTGRYYAAQPFGPGPGYDALSLPCALGLNCESGPAPVADGAR